jgi:hypothetical protein
LSILVPRTAGARRVVVSLRQGAHRRETGDAERGDARFRTAANHRVGIAALNEPERVANGVCAGGARRRHRRIGSLGAEPHRDEAGREVDDRGEDEERRDAVRTALEQYPMFPLDHLESADAAADDDPDTGRVGGGHLQPALLHRHGRGGDGELDEAGALLDVFLVEPLERVEGRDLAGEPGGIPCRIEQRNRTDA